MSKRRPGRKPSQQTINKRFRAYLAQLIPKTLISSILFVTLIFLHVYGVTSKTNGVSESPARPPYFSYGFSYFNSSKINYENNITDYTIKNATSSSPTLNVTATLDSIIHDNTDIPIPTSESGTAPSTAPFFDLYLIQYDKLNDILKGETDIRFVKKCLKLQLQSSQQAIEDKTLTEDQKVIVQRHIVDTASYLGNLRIPTPIPIAAPSTPAKDAKPPTKQLNKKWFLSIFTLEFWFDSIYDTSLHIWHNIKQCRKEFTLHTYTLLTLKLTWKQYLREILYSLWMLWLNTAIQLAKRPLIFIFYLFIITFFIGMLVFFGLTNLTWNIIKMICKTCIWIIHFILKAIYWIIYIFIYSIYYLVIYFWVYFTKKKKKTGNTQSNSNNINLHFNGTHTPQVVKSDTNETMVKVTHSFLTQMIEDFRDLFLNHPFTDSQSSIPISISVHDKTDNDLIDGVKPPSNKENDYIPQTSASLDDKADVTPNDSKNITQIDSLRKQQFNTHLPIPKVVNSFYDTEYVPNNNKIGHPKCVNPDCSNLVSELCTHNPNVFKSACSDKCYSEWKAYMRDCKPELQTRTYDIINLQKNLKKLTKQAHEVNFLPNLWDFITSVHTFCTQNPGIHEGVTRRWVIDNLLPEHIQQRANEINHYDIFQLLQWIVDDYNDGVLDNAHIMKQLNTWQPTIYQSESRILTSINDIVQKAFKSLTFACLYTSTGNPIYNKPNLRKSLIRKCAENETLIFTQGLKLIMDNCGPPNNQQIKYFNKSKIEEYQDTIPNFAHLPPNERYTLTYNKAHALLHRVLPAFPEMNIGKQTNLQEAMMIQKHAPMRQKVQENNNRMKQNARRRQNQRNNSLWRKRNQNQNINNRNTDRKNNQNRSRSNSRSRNNQQFRNDNRNRSNRNNQNRNNDRSRNRRNDRNRNDNRRNIHRDRHSNNRNRNDNRNNPRNENRNNDSKNSKYDHYPDMNQPFCRYGKFCNNKLCKKRHHCKFDKKCRDPRCNMIHGFRDVQTRENSIKRRQEQISKQQATELHMMQQQESANELPDGYSVPRP